MCTFSSIGAGDGKIHQQENGSANGIVDFVSSRRQSTRARAESSKEHAKTPLIEVKIFSSCIGSFKYFNSINSIYLIHFVTCVTLYMSNSVYSPYQNSKKFSLQSISRL